MFFREASVVGQLIFLRGRESTSVAPGFAGAVTWHAGKVESSQILHEKTKLGKNELFIEYLSRISKF